MRADGNLVLRNQSGVVWSTKTADVAAGGYAIMGHDGRLKVIDTHGRVRFHTHNATTNATQRLHVRDNGQLAIYRKDKIVWHTYTHTP
jgi:hypothetical protein